MTNSHTEVVQEPPQAMEGQDTVFKCVKCDLEIANCGNEKTFEETK